MKGKKCYAQKVLLRKRFCININRGAHMWVRGYKTDPPHSPKKSETLFNKTETGCTWTPTHIFLEKQPPWIFNSCVSLNINN